MTLPLESETAHPERDEEAPEDEADGSTPLGCGPNEKRDSDPDEDEGEEHDRPAVERHDASDAVTSTRQEACLRT